MDVQRECLRVQQREELELCSIALSDDNLIEAGGAAINQSGVDALQADWNG